VVAFLRSLQLLSLMKSSRCTLVVALCLITFLTPRKRSRLKPRRLLCGLLKPCTRWVIALLRATKFLKLPRLALRKLRQSQLSPAQSVQLLLMALLLGLCAHQRLWSRTRITKLLIPASLRCLPLMRCSPVDCA